MLRHTGASANRVQALLLSFPKLASGLLMPTSGDTLFPRCNWLGSVAYPFTEMITPSFDAPARNPRDFQLCRQMINAGAIAAVAMVTYVGFLLAV